MWEKIHTETSLSHNLLTSNLLAWCSVQVSPCCQAAPSQQCCSCACADVQQRQLPELAQQPAGHTNTALVPLLIPPCVLWCHGALETSAESHNSPANSSPIHCSPVPSTALSFFLPLLHVSIIGSRANQSFPCLTICFVLHTAKKDKGSP